MKHRTVQHPHTTTYYDPITIRAGEEVTVGHEDAEFPGWVWCTDPRGKSGWVPKSTLEFSFDGNSARSFEDYDATELTVSRGDMVTVLGEESGWLWCENARGKRGWIPKENVS
jgi:uncharacterized protein YgiM (DUF1202 family)